MIGSVMRLNKSLDFESVSPQKSPYSMFRPQRGAGQLHSWLLIKKIYSLQEDFNFHAGVFAQYLSSTLSKNCKVM